MTDTRDAILNLTTDGLETVTRERDEAWEQLAAARKVIEEYERFAKAKLLTTAQTAEMLGDMSVRTLEDWRRKGVGPNYVPLSAKCVRYRLADVEDWIKARVRKLSAGLGDS